LDAIVRAELRYELRKLASDLGLTVIHVTHDQEEALSIADRVVIMKNGRIIEVGRPAEIYHHPKTLFTANFVGETNLIEGTVSKVDGALCTIDILNYHVNLQCHRKHVGQRIVISIRPESVLPSPQTEEGWAGRVKQVAFLGSLNRYVIDVGGIDVVSEISTAEYNTNFGVGETVSLFLEEANMTLFDYPEEGLEREIALE